MVKCVVCKRKLKDKNKYICPICKEFFILRREWEKTFSKKKLD